MGKKWLAVHVDEKTGIALAAMARTDYRTPAQQLVWLARQEAERRGLLQTDDQHGEAQVREVSGEG